MKYWLCNNIKKILKEEIVPCNQKINGYYYPINPRNKAFGFPEKLFAIQKLSIDEDKLVQTGVLHSETTCYYPISENLFKSEKTGLISLSLVEDSLEGEVIHMGTTVLKSTNFVRAFLPIVITCLWQFIILVSVLFFPIWIIRKKRGKIPKGAAIRVRIWPFLSGISAILMIGLLSFGSILNPIKYFGHPTWISVGLMISTITFATFAVLGVYTSFKNLFNIF